MDIPKFGLDVLFHQKLAADQASFDAQNIAQDYMHMVMMYKLRNDASASAEAKLTFNNDTGNNYYDMLFRSTSTTAALFASDTAIAFIHMHGCVGSDADASVFATGIMFIPDYAST